MNSELIVFLLEGGQLAQKHKLNVKGKLSILHLERVENPVDTKEATVAQKENLHHLIGENMVNLNHKNMLNRYLNLLNLIQILSSWRWKDIKAFIFNIGSVSQS